MTEPVVTFKVKGTLYGAASLEDVDGMFVAKDVSVWRDGSWVFFTTTSSEPIYFPVSLCSDLRVAKPKRKKAPSPLPIPVPLPAPAVPAPAAPAVPAPKKTQKSPVWMALMCAAVVAAAIYGDIASLGLLIGFFALVWVK